MNSRFTILLLTSLFWIANVNAGDTLRHYPPTYAPKSSENPYKDYDFIAIWFGVDQPAVLKSVKLLLDRDTGRMKLQVFGHEGGFSFPLLMEDQTDPVWIKKTKQGREWITYTFKEPIKIPKTQFFIGLSESTSDSLSVAYDQSTFLGNTPACKIPDGLGNSFYYNYLRKNKRTGDFALDWVVFDLPIIIDAVVEYPNGNSPSLYKDITSETGIFEFSPDDNMACADYNNDGFLDILVDGVLYHNKGDNTFEDLSLQSVFVEDDILASAFIDVDNDGKLDVLHIGKNFSTIHINEGNKQFSQKYSGKIPSFDEVSSISIADLNNDKYPDIFIGQYEVPGNPNNAAYPNYYFINDGNFDFDDSTKVFYPSGSDHFKARASSFVDFDDDTDLDLYIANYRLERDEFYENKGDGSFVNIIDEKQMDVNNGVFDENNHGTGVHWADYDNDGDMDLLLSQFAHPWFRTDSVDHRTLTIYRNEGAPDYQFTDLDGQLGIRYEETSAGVAWGDVNNDGLMDIIRTTYYPCRYIDLYVQRADHTFEDKTFEYGLFKTVNGDNTKGNDAIFADINNDGKQDLLLGVEGKLRLFINQQTNGNNFVKIKLNSQEANSQAIGARVKVYADDGSVYTQEIVAGRGQLKQDPYTLHFGLAQATGVDSVQVRWPGDTAYMAYDKITINDLNKLSDKPIGITEFLTDEIKLRIFPNPSSGIFIIEANTPDNAKLELTVRSIAGKVIYTGDATGQGQVKIDLTGYAKGYYILELQMDNRSWFNKLVRH